MWRRRAGAFLGAGAAVIRPTFYTCLPGGTKIRLRGDAGPPAVAHHRVMRSTAAAPSLAECDMTRVNVTVLGGSYAVINEGRHPAEAQRGLRRVAAESELHAVA
jgi:hypothetical protein